MVSLYPTAGERTLDARKYSEPEEQARRGIDDKLRLAGWTLQHFKDADIHAAKGVAVEYFQMGRGVGEADYVLFVDGQAVGIIEAKKKGETLIGKETQTKGYGKGFPKQFSAVSVPLPFLYESTGVETRFTNLFDPTPRSRDVFSFYTPESLAELAKEGKGRTLRARLQHIPALRNDRLWEAQAKAISGIEESLAKGRPRALVQMATGSGKTYMAVNLAYRLIKNGGAKRILFLVDRTNLGIQTKKEFEGFLCPEENRKFTELYNVQRLETSSIEGVSKVVISTIQRVYSMLVGKELPPELEERSGFEAPMLAEPLPVAYNPAVLIDTFDFIIVDECHRSIYNLWRQVLDYFDAFIIGLTATPSKHTFGFFDKNLVMEYTHEEAVADQVNVDFSVYKIRTRITQKGSTIEAGEVIQKRNRRTRERRWESLSDDVQYSSEDLDRSVVTPDQIRTVIRAFRDKVRTEIFPGRRYVPKTLIYAKDDNHAEEIVRIIREEFDEGNDFAVKITYKTEGEKPDNLIRAFRNEFNPRIAVTVDMIATGTDIKPLEIVFFMREVKSRTYFEQMKGRGVRVMKHQDFISVTPDGFAKERFVIVDAVGVCENEGLSDTSPLDQVPSMPFAKLLQALQFGKPTKEYVGSLASRFSRLEKKLSDEQKVEVESLTSGLALTDIARGLVNALDEDAILQDARTKSGKEAPTQKELDNAAESRMREALMPLLSNPKFLVRLPEIKQEAEQIIDTVSVDEVTEAGYSPLAREQARKVVGTFKTFLEKNKDEIVALQVLYGRPKRRQLNLKDLKDLARMLKNPPLGLTPARIWSAYEELEREKVRGRTRGSVADLVALVRFTLEQGGELEPYHNTVDKHFSQWLKHQTEIGRQFTNEQLKWLELIKEHVAESLDIRPDDFELAPFDRLGGLGRASQVFGRGFSDILTQLNEALSV